MIRSNLLQLWRERCTGVPFVFPGANLCILRENHPHASFQGLAPRATSHSNKDRTNSPSQPHDQWQCFRVHFQRTSLRNAPHSTSSTSTSGDWCITYLLPTSSDTMPLRASSHCNFHAFGAPDRPAVATGLGHNGSPCQVEAAACAKIALGVRDVQGTIGKAMMFFVLILDPLPTGELVHARSSAMKRDRIA